MALLDNTSSDWHLDKKVPLALIFALLIQTATAFWWAAKLESKVDSNTIAVREVSKIKSVVTRIDERVKILLQQRITTYSKQ